MIIFNHWPQYCGHLTPFTTYINYVNPIYLTISISSLKSQRSTQAVDTVVAGILHDVIDDTSESLDTIEREFDDDVAKLVAGVSRLSYINQVNTCCRLVVMVFK